MNDMEAVGPLQIRVLHHLWNEGPCTVHDVHVVLNLRNLETASRQLAYTTVLTVMRNLVRRKILSQLREGRAHLFAPLIEREHYQLGILRRARAELFGGDGAALLRLMADDDQLDASLRERLRQVTA